MELRNQFFIVILCGIIALLSTLTLKDYVGALVVAGALGFTAITYFIISRRGAE